MMEAIIQNYSEKGGTNIAFGTTADYAYELYLDKLRKINALKYECELLIDKYHSEMRNASIPSQFRQDIIEDMFAKGDDEGTKKRRDFAREFFLGKCFSEEFRKENEIEFSNIVFHGYNRAAVAVEMDIGDYVYSVEVPLPHNIEVKEDKERSVGQVKFRADKILKSNANAFCRVWKAVQMPTYDWTACFDAIERDVLALKKGQQTN